MQAQIPYESEEKVHNLCTYPPGIEYEGTNPMQARICAHIPRELNMQTLEEKEMEVETKVTPRQEPH